MTIERSNSSNRPSGDHATVVRAVTVIMGVVVGLTFTFGFGNVLNLALRLGVPVWVAPLVAPAVDLSVLGLLLGTRYLALAGASADQLRPARRLLMFASVVTLALNVADPLVAGEFGKAAFDAVGPLLLIGWAEVGPGFLQAINLSSVPSEQEMPDIEQADSRVRIDADGSDEPDRPSAVAEDRVSRDRRKACWCSSSELLLEQARREDAAHRVAHQRPISADTLRMRLGIGATRARRLVRSVRAERQTQVAHDPVEVGAANETAGVSTTWVA
jgi:hypothetical protein